MSVTLAQILQIQSALYGAVRAALTGLNEETLAQGLRLAEWPIERAGCLYTLAITLERAGREIGECRFTIDWRGDTYFDADDEILARCEPADVETALRTFVDRRATPAAARNAA
jgi:hypothetical protein